MVRGRKRSLQVLRAADEKTGKLCEAGDEARRDFLVPGTGDEARRDYLVPGTGDEARRDYLVPGIGDEAGY